MKTKLPIVSFLACIITMVIGILAIIGWFTHNDILRSMIHGIVMIKFNTALCFLFSSIVLLLNYLPRKNKILHFVSILLSVMISLMGLLTLLEFISGFNFGIDEFFIKDEFPTTAVYFAGRMSPLSAINFLFIGTGLLLLNKERTATYQFFYLFTIAFISLMMLICFNFIAAIPTFILIAIYTAIGFISLSIAILFAQPMLQKKISFKRKLFTGFTALIILMVIISLISSYYRDKLISTSKSVNHSNNVLSEAEHILSLVNDIESGGRDYILSGNQDYVEYFPFAKNAVLRHVIKLKELTKDNPGQRVRVDSLSVLVDKRIAFSQQCIQVRNESGFESGKAFLAARSGKFHNDMIWNLTSAIRQVENNLLAQRQIENDKSILSFKYAFFIFLAGIFILLVIILFSIHNNIIVHKKAEDKIKESELRYRSLIEQATDAICIADASMKIIDINPSGCQVLGYSKDEFLQLSISDLFFTNDLKINPLKIHELKSGKEVNSERKLKRKDGQAIEMEVNAKMLEDGRFVVFARDIRERKKTDKALQAAYNEKNTILESIDDGFFTVDKSSLVTYWNKRAEILLNTKGEDIIGKNLHEMFSPDEPNIFYDHYQKAIRENSTVHFEGFSARTDKWFEVSAFASDKGLSVYFKDITDRKRSEGKLITTSNELQHALTEQVLLRKKTEESERRYRRILETAQEGIWMIDENNITTFVNKKMCEILEYTEEEMMGRTNLSFKDEEEQKNALEQIERRKKGEKEVHESKFITKSGRHIFIQVSTNPILAEDGKYKGALAMMTDITERKRAEDKIKESELRYRSLNEQATDAICITDAAMKFIDINPYACETFGYTLEEALQLSLPDILFAEDLADNPIKLTELKLGKIIRNERRLKRKDGTGVNMEVSTKIMEDGRLIMFGHDISNRKKAEEVLKESNKRFEYVTKATFDAIWDWDIVTNKVFFGDGFVHLFGAINDGGSDLEMVHKRIHPEDIQKLLDSAYMALKGKGLNWSYEHRYLKSGGDYAYVSNKALIIRDRNGKAKRVIGAMQDITDKKVLEDLLEKATRLARIGSWEVDLTKSTVYWSNITKEIHEVEPGFIPGLQTGIDFCKAGESRNLLLQKIEDAKENFMPFDVELQIITAKGNEKWVRSIGETEFMNGKCVRVYGSFQDIDVRKRAELAVIEVFKEKNTILESIDDAFFAVDKNWTVTYWNKKAEKLLGKTKTEILYKDLWEVFSNSIDSESYKKYHHAIETNQSVHFEDYYPTLAKWYEVSAYPSKNGLSVYFSDITGRKNAVTELAASEKRFSDLFNLSPQPMWVFDPETYKFVQVNKATIDLYGYSEEEFLNMTLVDILGDEDIAKAKKQIKKGKIGDEMFKGTYMNCKKSGEIFEVEIYSTWIRINGKSLRSVIAIDVTEKNLYEHMITKAIIKTQEDERYEIGGELHDNVCQILAASQLNLGMLKDSLAPSRMLLFNLCRDNISLATEEIRNLSHRLAPVFFEESTMEEAFIRLFDTFNIDKKLGILLQFSDVVRNYPLSLEIQLNLYRILQEQLRNIQKYANASLIEVDVLIYNNKLKMKISDNGVGFNVDTAKDGIGLANMKRRAELFSGKLEIDSSPGKGCTIVIDIPLQETQKQKKIVNGVF